MKVICKMQLNKETKGALQYKQTEQDGKPTVQDGMADQQGLIGTLYVRKAHMHGMTPTIITVTVEA